MDGVISIEDSRYPLALKSIADPPERIFYKGVWDERIFENCLAVVGTRRMTGYGKRITEQLVSQIASAGITIVSGFMYGIDATAHRAAVQSPTLNGKKSGFGRTIAVMPCGIERIHPEYQKDLYERILATGGLILSEWDGNAMPMLWTYPKRNRIVAGLAKATLIVEAGLESGSLITASFAKKFGRKLFAVPGPLTSEVSKGTIKLLREGASIVTSADDILDFYEIKFQIPKPKSQTNPKSQNSNTLEERIFETLRRESFEADLIARTLQIPAAELGTMLSLMELRGLIKQERGKYYVN